MSSKTVFGTTWRVTLVYPPHAAINKDSEGKKICREVFPNCTGLDDSKGYLSFVDVRGRKHITRIMYHAEEE